MCLPQRALALTLVAHSHLTGISLTFLLACLLGPVLRSSRVAAAAAAVELLLEIVLFPKYSAKSKIHRRRFQCTPHSAAAALNGSRCRFASCLKTRIHYRSQRALLFHYSCAHQRRHRSKLIPFNNYLHSPLTSLLPHTHTP